MRLVRMANRPPTPRSVGGLIHRLKCWPEPFEAVRTGRKTFEVRRDDRPGGFREGDFLRLDEWSPATLDLGIAGRYTGRTLLARVRHVVKGGRPPAPLPTGVVVLGIEVEPDPKEEWP